MMQDRISDRRRTLKQGKVLLTSSSLIDCEVRDLSDTGARIEFAGPTLLPSEFKLRIAHGDLDRLVELTWQRGLSAGVRFGATAQ